MAHQITDTDNLFSVREATWHGLGAILPEHPSREEAQQIAHPWEPVEEAIHINESYLDDEGQEVPVYPTIADYKAITRSDNGAILGVVGKDYQPVLNSDLWDIAEALQGAGVDVQYETAGSLAGGKKVWVLLKLQEPLMVNGDPNGGTIPYYSLQNSHDGSGAFRGQATMVRIVCANTSHIADIDARTRGTEFTFRHSKNIGERIEEARQALTGWRSSLEEWQRKVEWWTTIQADEFDERDFLEAFIPMPPPGVASDRVRGNVDEARRVWESIYRSETCEGIIGTLYGLVQASVEYAEHFRVARTQETRFRRAYLDRNKVVADAARIAREVVGVR